MAEILKVIDASTEILEVIDYLKDKEFVAVDTETTGVDKSAEIIGYSVCAEEGLAYYVILAKWDTAQSKLIYLDTKANSLLLFETLKTKKLIGHNFTFDASMIELNFKISLIEALHTDTMILAHLLDENRRVGLKELAVSMYGQNSDVEAKEMKESAAANGAKLTKTCYEIYKADPYILGKYGAKDTILTYRLFLDLVPELYNQGLDKFFYEEESMPLLKGPTYELNTTGLQVDVKALQTLKKTLEAECEEAKAFIYREIDTYVKEKYPGTTKANTFNIGASQQLSWLLFGRLGLEFGTLTKGGKLVSKSLLGSIPYSYGAKHSFIEECFRREGQTVGGKKIRKPWAYIACDKKTLVKFKDKYKWVDRLLEYQKKQKLLSTYVEGIQSRIQYGTIHPNFLQHGTTSGRYSSRNPNWQNLPRDDKRIKQCIIARPGKLLVGADYSQLEPRVFAYFSQDIRLMECFTSGKDFYSVIGIEVYGKYDATPYKDGSPEAFGIKYKRLRDLSKVIALASTYGASAYQLSSTTGKSADDTQMDIDEYFERFPGVRTFQNESHSLCTTNGRVTSLFGRPRRMPNARYIPKLPHNELPYEARNMLNLAVNHRVQSTGASIVNRAAIAFYNAVRKAGISCKFVNQVHDSIVIECDQKDAEDVALLLQHCMEETIQLKGVKLEAVPQIGSSLAEVWA